MNSAIFLTLFTSTNIHQDTDGNEKCHEEDGADEVDQGDDNPETDDDEEHQEEKDAADTNADQGQ